METKTIFKKKKKAHGFIFITSLSFAGVLVGWAVATAKDARPLPLDSSLAGMGKVTKTISWLWETTPPLEESVGAARGFVVLGPTSLGFSFPSQLRQLAQPFLDDCWEEEGPWLVSHQWSLNLRGLHHPGRLKDLVLGLQGGNKNSLLS